MRNSTIISKKKNLKCGHFDYNFSKSRCKQCATIESTEARAKKAMDEQPKRKAGWFSLDNEELKIASASNTGKMQRWFEERHSEMKGTCKNCGGKSQKGKDNYKCSIAHILPKAYFKSIATHRDNWIELCFYDNSCHTNFDNHMIDIIDLNCFDEVIQKFVRMYPFIAIEERKRIPKILLEYLKTEL